jgi:hypothetical protein
MDRFEATTSITSRIASPELEHRVRTSIQAFQTRPSVRPTENASAVITALLCHLPNPPIVQPMITNLVSPVTLRSRRSTAICETRPNVHFLILSGLERSSGANVTVTVPSVLGRNLLRTRNRRRFHHGDLGRFLGALERPATPPDCHALAWICRELHASR